MVKGASVALEYGVDHVTDRLHLMIFSSGTALHIKDAFGHLRKVHKVELVILGLDEAFLVLHAQVSIDVCLCYDRSKVEKTVLDRQFLGFSGAVSQAEVAPPLNGIKKLGLLILDQFSEVWVWVLVLEIQSRTIIPVSFNR